MLISDRKKFEAGKYLVCGGKEEEEELLVTHPPVEGMMIFVKENNNWSEPIPLLCVADVSSSTTPSGENIKRSLAQ